VNGIMRTTSRTSSIAVFAAMLALVPAVSGASARPPGKPYRETIAVRWNEAALEAVRHSRMGPPAVARALAIVHTCMYDAWAAYDRKAFGSRLGKALRRPARERSAANREEAVSVAAHHALGDLFPSDRHIFDGLLEQFGYGQAGASTDPSTPAGVAHAACSAVLAFRHADGSNQLGDLNGGAPYSDYTGYAPVNTPAMLNDPNRWQPIAFGNGQTPGFLTPQWGMVTPFASRRPRRPPPPAFYPSERYLTQALALRRIREQLTDRQKMIAEYWSDGPASETPPGHWNLLAAVVSRRDRHSLDEDVKMFFALNNALLDAGIASWECKRFYDYVRPISAIRFLTGTSWTPYQPGTFLTPPFPEYVSGHSTFSASAAEVLKQFTGSDVFRHGVVLARGSSKIEPGSTPRRAISLYWPTFSTAADQAGLSRRLGGIHFRDGDLEGRALGRRTGRLVWARANTLFEGTGGE
jgi:hypothetical protein